LEPKELFEDSVLELNIIYCRVSGCLQRPGTRLFYFYNKELELWIKQKGHLSKTVPSNAEDKNGIQALCESSGK